ncbi:SusD/RagB family nutrient-binding outer membrane lipoprotein [Limibacter armeniacum]|uniref:SusD/RagB family nutrient-binding outer membrane lipoprotein n=1 Tax=Limibacter armeniacum TaxID=466084 RepID=UPI002FE66319
MIRTYTLGISWLVASGLLLSMLLGACTGHFDEINTSKTGMTELEPEPIFTRSLRLGSLDYTYYQRMQQLYVNFYSQYYANFKEGWYTDSYYYNDEWADYFWNGNYADKYGSFLSYAHHAAYLSRESDQSKKEACAMIWEVFLLHRVTDIWGDIPYSQAFGENISPAFDTQKQVYEQMLDKLVMALDMLPKEDPNVEWGAADILFNDDLGQWRRFAQSMILKLAIRVSNVAPEMTMQYIKKMDQYELLQSNEHSVKMQVMAEGGNERNQNPIMWIDKFDEYRVSKYLVDRLKSLNDPRLEKMADPVQYYVDQLRSLLSAVHEYADNSVSADLYTDLERQLIKSYMELLLQRDGISETGKQGIETIEAFVTSLVERSSSTLLKNKLETFNNEKGELYKGMINGVSPDQLVHYEKNRYSRTSSLMIAPDYPTYLYLYAEVCFLQAEACLKGWLSGNAEQHYQNGIRASMEMFNIGEAEVDDYLRTEAGKLTSTNALEQIITQKWIANINNGFESWAEYRRTGYPSLYTVPSGGETGGKMPQRLKYPSTEKTLNGESVSAATQRIGGDLMTTKLWWAGGK